MLKLDSAFSILSWTIYSDYRVKRNFSYLTYRFVLAYKTESKFLGNAFKPNYLSWWNDRPVRLSGNLDFFRPFSAYLLG